MRRLYLQIKHTLNYEGYVSQVAINEEAIFIPFGISCGSAKHAARNIRKLPLPAGVSAKVMEFGKREYVVIYKQ